MKHIIAILILVTSLNSFSQTITINPTTLDFIGTWEWQNGNEVFRINLFNDTTSDGSLTIRGHYSMLQIDGNGDETILYTSNRLIEDTNENWIPMINGGRYLESINCYRFSLRDNTTNDFLLGVLDLKFLNTNSDNPIQISWKLRIDGMADENQSFNVPTDIILTKL